MDNILAVEEEARVIVILFLFSKESIISLTVNEFVPRASAKKSSDAKQHLSWTCQDQI